MDTNLEIITRVKRFLIDVKEKALYRKHFTIKDKAFTKNRKLPIENVVYLIIGLLKRSLNIELDEFFSSNFPGKKSASKAAFSVQRSKLGYTFFAWWNTILVDSFYNCYKDKVKRWRGFRIMAVDGSTAYLINKPELIQYFGVQANHAMSIAMGRIMQVHDVLNDITVCAQMLPISISEQAIIKSWIPFFEKDMLAIYDRGFPSFAMIFLHLSEERPVNFVMRCKNGFNKEVSAFEATESRSQIVDFMATENSVPELKKYGYIITNKTTVKVRLVKVLLEDGTVEILITNLLDEKEYPNDVFKDLYFKRWGIETNYGTKKNCLQMEIFSGYKVNTILQDFYATVFVNNLQSILSKPSEERINNNKSNRKYNYKPNKNIAIGLLKKRIVPLFMIRTPLEILIELDALFERYTEPIRLGRRLPRKVKTKRIRGKYQTLTNYKRAI